MNDVFRGTGKRRSAKNSSALVLTQKSPRRHTPRAYRHSGIADIAGQAVAQSSTIKEINTAIGELDSTTQQNAAMGEEVTASCRSLAEESAQLKDMLSKFVFRDANAQKAAGEGKRADAGDAAATDGESLQAAA